jgi:hypothetical protein
MLTSVPWTALLKHFLADIQQKRAATEAHWQREY